MMNRRRLMLALAGIPAALGLSTRNVAAEPEAALPSAPSRRFPIPDLRGVRFEPPVGAVMGKIGAVSDGYLVCDGRAVSCDDFPALFEVIGFTYGRGDEPGTFRLPNLDDWHGVIGMDFAAASRRECRCPEPGLDSHVHVPVCSCNRTVETRPRKVTMHMVIKV